MQKMIIDEYILNLPKIGEGSFGEVYLASKKNSKEIFAAKKVEKQKIMSEKLRQYFFDEIRILENLNHSNIMRLIEVKSSLNNIYLITEYCNGGSLSENLVLYQKIHKTPLPEKIVIHIMKQIADAIHYLHERRIIHRDLKLENIMVHFENLEDMKKLNLLNARVKIIDFGFARYLKDDGNTNTVLGTANHMEPGILHALVDPQQRKNLKYNEKADIYSIGVIMFTLLIGKPPFNARDHKELFSKVNYGIFSIPKDLKLSNECITLMNGMMMQASSKRFSIIEVLRSDFLSKPYEKFEFVDFSELENANSNSKQKVNYGLQHNENYIFLDIKQMISLDNNKHPQQLNENNKDNKDDLNVVLNDVNNKDKELEQFLEKLNANKMEDNSTPKRNLNNFDAPKEKNFLPQKPQEDKLNGIPPRTEPNFTAEKKSNDNLNEISKGKEAENKPAKDLEVAKQEEKDKKNDNFQSPNAEFKKILIEPRKGNSNLINFDNNDNTKGFFVEEPKKKSDTNSAQNSNEDNVKKGIFDIPIQKLFAIFESFNKKFESFEIEAIPIYLENPQHYENFIL